MKHLSKLAAIFAALALTCAFIGCSDGSSSDDNNSSQNSSNSGNTNSGSPSSGSVPSAIVGTYTGSFSPQEGVTVKVTIVIKEDGTWTGTQVVGGQTSDLSGTFTVSGTTVAMTSGGKTMNATTTDNWNTFVFKAGNTDVTMTKQ